MRFFSLSIIIFFNFIISSTWLQYTAIFGIIPNLTLVIVVCYALLRDDTEAAIVGFLAGLLQDILFGQIIGISALLMMFTGFLAAKPFKEYYQENYIIPLVVVSIASLAYETAFYIINFLLLGRVNFIRYFGQIILPTAAYNILASIIIYRLIYALNQKLLKRDERKKGFMNKKPPFK